MIFNEPLNSVTGSRPVRPTKNKILKLKAMESALKWADIFIGLCTIVNLILKPMPT
jgi:hypothetical protein